MQIVRAQNTKGNAEASVVKTKLEDLKKPASLDGSYHVMFTTDEVIKINIEGEPYIYGLRLDLAK